MLSNAFEYDDDMNEPKLTPIYAPAQFEMEVVYSDLLQRLLVFINSLRSFTGLWREHVKLIEQLTASIHLFYMPEIHQTIVPMLLEFVCTGNRDMQEAACMCIAKIIKY